jgi:hypothetical protein
MCAWSTRPIKARAAIQIELRKRFAISNPKNVAPFANGELRDIASATIKKGERSCRTHRINVGTSPLVNALMPSVFHTVRAQCSADRYFCPSDGENPSVCIRDLTISMGYITDQSFWSSAIRWCSFHQSRKITHSIARRRAIQDGATRAYLVSPNVLQCHLTLH